ncbi:hypothetical protein F5B19DRAFT_476776 [Rostrohypoxylon terebratum]|nr:hypothetical protein F5B19DRAFT_476776 [Rostrohypoxylon terebratum]
MGFDLPVLEAKVDFIRDLPLYHTQKPYYLAGPLDPENEHLRTNAIFEQKSVVFHDLRGHEGLFTLKKNGFEFMLDSGANVKALNELSEKTVEPYARDSVKLMKRLFNTDKCWCYAYKFRSSADIDRPPGKATGDRGFPDEPATKAHIDHTLDGGFRRIRRHFTKEEQDEFIDDKQSKWRLLIVNTWRPLNGTIADYPLAVCDPATVKVPDDGIATDRVSPEFQGENYYLKYRDNYDWYWLSDHQVNEVLLFISFDSARNMKGSFTPHCSFKVPGASNDCRPRESIETRTVVAIPRDSTIS